MTTKFQQRHYEAIADALRELRQRDSVVWPYGVVAQLVRLFEADNPRFDRERFERACEP